VADIVPDELPADGPAEVRRLREAVERLTADRGAIQRSTDGITAGLDQVRAELAEVNRRTEHAETRVEEVDASAQTRILDEAAALRTQIRTRVIVAVVALLVVAAVVLAAWVQQRREAGRFARVHQGLIEACAKSQASNAALRTKNTKLRNDTHALVLAAEDVDAPGPVLSPIVAYLRAEEVAYNEYLLAIPAPVDCRARYGDR
jgi:hypothetical protein